jgi:predicted secreted protein
VKLQSILAIYILFWTMCLFLVLPFGVRTPEEEGVKCPPGHAPSAPHRFSLGKVALRTTIVSALLFGLFYANFHFGWIDIAALDWAAPPER